MKSIALTLILFASTAFAQSDALSEVLNTTRGKAGIPGMVVFYAKENKISEVAASGIRKIGSSTAITTNDKLHIGSITKSMTAFLLATYIDEGKLTWKSTLSDLFPEATIVPELKDVTLELLLTHRSGLDGGLNRFAKELDEFYETVKPTTVVQERAGIVSILLKNTPQFKPATKYSYSNNGYLMIGHILERHSGKSWEELIIERLFNPLDMKSCGFGFPGVDQPWGHAYDKQGVLQSSDKDNHPVWSPAGRVHCDAADLNKYFSFHQDGLNGKGTLLKKESFEKLYTNYPGGTYTYGGLIRIERIWAGGPVLTHSGTNLENMAYVWIAPKKNLSLFGFANLGGEEKDPHGERGGDKAAKAIDDMIGSMIDLASKTH